MLIETIIVNNIRANILLIIFICLVQVLHAQINDTLPPAGTNSPISIKQLLHHYLSQQLQQYKPYKKSGQYALQRLLKDSTAVDSMENRILQQVQLLKKSTILAGKCIAMSTWQSSKQILEQQFEQVIKAGHLKDLIHQFADIAKQPSLQWRGGSLDIAVQATPSLLNDRDVVINSTAISGNWSVMGIPMEVQVTRQNFTGPEYYLRNTFSFRFNREAYLNSIKDKIKPGIRPADLLPDYNDVLQRLRSASVTRLKASLDSIGAAWTGRLSRQLASLGNVESLLKTSINTIQDKLLSAPLLQNIEQNKNLLAQMQQHLNTGGTENAKLYDSLLQSVQSVTGINTIIKTIRLFKEEAQKSGLMEKLLQAEQFKQNNMQQWLQQPDKLIALAKNQLDLNGIQKVFLNIDHLAIGMNTINLSPLALYQYINNGVNASFFHNNMYLFVMAGRRQNLFNTRFTEGLFSADNMSVGLRAGKGDINQDHTHISFFTYKQSSSNQNNAVINTMPGRTAVATFSKRLKLNETSYLHAELSKSAHQYTNQQSIYDSPLQNNSMFKQLQGGANFIQQTAFTVQWNGETGRKAIDYNVHGTVTGKGYTNPGNLFITSGTTELGGNIRKSFLKNQLQIAARGNYRQYNYSSNNSKWRNYNFSLLGKYKLRPGMYICLRYQTYQSLRVQDHSKYHIGSTNCLSIESSFRRRFGGVYYQHTLDLTALKNSYQVDNIPVNNKSVCINSAQIITNNRRSCYLNLQYNNANASFLPGVFNTQFNADAGYMYVIGAGIACSTAISYNRIYGWFEQVGIKQTVSGHIGGRFMTSIYTDIGRNIRTYRSGINSNTRFSWSLQYSLK